MIVRKWSVIASFLAFVVLGSAANADPVLPVRTGSVVDAANIIDSSQEQTLATKAARLKSTSNVELVVVTLPSLRGYSIERWGQALGRGWKVGGSAAHGALLIVAPNEREVRIEVGDGLPFSDSAASSIVDNIIVPKFRSGDMSGGILAGVDAIARAATQLETDSVSYPQPQPTRDVNWYAAGPLLLLVLLGIFVVLRAMSGVLEEEPAHGPSQREARPEPSSVLTKDTSSDGRRSGWFTSDSMWSSSRSSTWLSSRGSSSRSFSSGRSSGGFSGRGASGRW
jgi:uncharacterized protein